MKSTKDKQVKHEVMLRFFNSTEREVSFVLEPWGETYPFGVDDEYVVIARSPLAGAPDVDLTEDGITVSGWAGSTMQLFRNGEELGAGSFPRTPVPVSPD
jgi:hypothetical protein